MEVRLKVFVCPCCGAHLKPPFSTCEYCDARLWTEDEDLVGSAPPPREDTAPLEQPPARVFQRSADRFEMSSVLQHFPSQGSETLRCLELPDDRFALVYLRTPGVDTDLPVDILQENLEENGDPGLAANVVLEELCRRGFSQKLECLIALFDPSRADMLSYNAGCADSLWWMSSEEGRVLSLSSYKEPLERKMLRQVGDQFRNDRPVALAAEDLVVAVSAGFCERGGSPWGNAGSVLSGSLNDNLGDDPLRVVTLAKNAFWERRVPADREKAPVGPVQVAAVRALLPAPYAGELATHRIQEFGSARYELACWTGPEDWLEMVPLQDERAVLIWVGSDVPLDDEVTAKMRKAIVDVLDRRDHGDNENPRQAGRDALAEYAAPRLAVIQLFDQWNRVKYFRHGWSQPLALGDRGFSANRGGGMQQFDEGGEATVEPGYRLFFPGSCKLKGDVASNWPGGKASRLYCSLQDHWKTRSGKKALEQVSRAILSDAPGTALDGLALVSGKR